MPKISDRKVLCAVYERRQAEMFRGNVRIVLATKGRITPVIQVIHGLCPKIRYMSRRRGFLYADAVLKPFLFVQTVLST